MNTVKILERKIVIQFFGAALILAPFVNMLLMIYIVKNQSHLPWAQIQISKILLTGKISQYVMIISSLIIGSIMLRGSKAAWKFVLIFIGIHVAIQIPTIGHDIKRSWLYGPLFLINVGLLLFIGDQLVFKHKTPEEKAAELADEKAKKAEQALKKVEKKIEKTIPQPVAPPQAARPQPTLQSTSQSVIPKPVAQAIKPVPIQKRPVSPPVPIKIPTKTLVEFVNNAEKSSWAELISISQAGLHLKKRKTATVPESIESKKVEFSFDQKTFIKAKYKYHQAENYFFEFEAISKSQSESLNNWLNKKMG